MTTPATRIRPDSLVNSAYLDSLPPPPPNSSIAWYGFLLDARRAFEPCGGAHHAELSPECCAWERRYDVPADVAAVTELVADFFNGTDRYAIGIRDSVRALGVDFTTLFPEVAVWKAAMNAYVETTGLNTYGAEPGYHVYVPPAPPAEPPF